MSHIEVAGYSERGMINAMMYEILYAHSGIEMLRNLLKLCIFPNNDPNFDSFQTCKIRIEQSFSDFGDLDLLVLLDGDFKQAVLLEAKVKTFQANAWSISAEWNKFQQIVQGVLPKSKAGSNLFIQLYRKMRLIYQLQNPQEKLQFNILGKRWSLGENEVVRKAARELSQYCSTTWLLALVPDSSKNIAEFFELPSFQTNLPNWNILNIGYLSWEKFESYCLNHSHEWHQTLANFEYNHGQIFIQENRFSQSKNTYPPVPGTSVTWNSPNGKQSVVIKNRGSKNTRVILRNGETLKVKNYQLIW